MIPIIYRGLKTIPGGCLGFCPSTVSLPLQKCKQILVLPVEVFHHNNPREWMTGHFFSEKFRLSNSPLEKNHFHVSWKHTILYLLMLVPLNFILCLHLGHRIERSQGSKRTEDAEEAQTGDESSKSQFLPSNGMPRVRFPLGLYYHQKARLPSISNRWGWCWRFSKRDM